jgi:hypothetical protein
MANKRVVLPGLGTRIIPFLLRLFPRGLILAAVGRIHLRKRGADKASTSSRVAASVPPQ